MTLIQQHGFILILAVKPKGSSQPELLVSAPSAFYARAVRASLISGYGSFLTKAKLITGSNGLATAEVDFHHFLTLYIIMILVFQ